MEDMIAKISIEAKSVSARSSSMLYGIPSPFTVRGFLTALFSRGNKIEWSDYCMDPFLYVIHKFSMRWRRTPYGKFVAENRRSADRLKGKQIPESILDDPLADIKTTLYVRVSSPEKIGRFFEDERSLEAHLLTMRFAGGRIEKASFSMMGRQEILESGGLDSVVRREGGRVHFIYDRPRTLEEAYLAMDRNDGYDKFLCLCGYRLLEDPRERKYARGGLRHAFAEPVYALGALKSVYGIDSVEDKFYRFGFDEKSKTVYTTTKGAEHV